MTEESKKILSRVQQFIANMAICNVEDSHEMYLHRMEAEHLLPLLHEWRVGAVLSDGYAKVPS